MQDALSIIIPSAAAIISAFIGAILAFRHQNNIQKRKNKIDIIGTLMAYRGLEAEIHDWVKALNIVDVYFYDNKKVRQLTHEYFKHCARPLIETGHYRKILVELISEMMKDVGYSDLQQTDIQDFYFPESLNRLYPLPNVKTEPPSYSPKP